MAHVQPFNGWRLGVVDRVQWHGLKGYKDIRKPQYPTRLFNPVARSADGDASSTPVGFFTLDYISFLSYCATSDGVCCSDVPFFASRWSERACRRCIPVLTQAFVLLRNYGTHTLATAHGIIMQNEPLGTWSDSLKALVPVVRGCHATYLFPVRRS